MRKLAILFVVVAFTWPINEAGAATTTPSTSPTTQPSSIAQNKKIASNLRHIGVLALVYLNAHKGHLPDDLGELCSGTTESPSIYVLPETKSTVPADWQDMPAGKQRDWVNRNAAFEYIGHELEFGTDYSAQTPLHMDQIVIAYQKEGDVAKGINIECHSL